MSQGRSAIDYQQPGIFERLALYLEGAALPRLQGSCGRVVCEPSWSWQVHLHDYDLWFALRGQGRARINEHTYRIEPGTLFLLRPQDRVQAMHDPDDCLMVIFMHLDFFEPGTQRQVELAAQWLPLRHRVIPHTGVLDGLLTRSVHLRMQHQPLARLEADLVMRQALLEVYRQDAILQGHMAAGPDARIQRVIDHVRNHPAQRISLEVAASMAGLSPRYLSTCFTQQVGMSLRAFQLQVRLERGLYLLNETVLGVGEIARMLGYDSVFLFCRQFKQQYGYPPGQVRRQY